MRKRLIDEWLDPTVERIGKTIEHVRNHGRDGSQAPFAERVLRQSGPEEPDIFFVGHSVPQEIRRVLEAAYAIHEHPLLPALSVIGFGEAADLIRIWKRR